jgi:hypothetical protein
MTILRSSIHGSSSVAQKKVFIELEPNLSSCIEEISEKILKSLITLIMKDYMD